MRKVFRHYPKSIAACFFCGVLSFMVYSGKLSSEWYFVLYFVALVDIVLLEHEIKKNFK
jgi:hypothetical protein